MLTILSKSDCIDILEYYNIPIPNNSNVLRRIAENIISKKLCKCIQNTSENTKQKRKI